MTVKTTSHLVTYGETFTVSGSLKSSDPAGPKVSNVQVHLCNAEPRPEDGKVLCGHLLTLNTDEGGNFTFRPYRLKDNYGGLGTVKNFQVWARYTNGTVSLDDDQFVKRSLGGIEVRALIHQVRVSRSPGSVLVVDGHAAPQAYKSDGTASPAVVDLFAGRPGKPLVHRGTYPLASLAWKFSLTRRLGYGVWNIRLKYTPSDNQTLPGYYYTRVALR